MMNTQHSAGGTTGEDSSHDVRSLHDYLREEHKVEQEPRLQAERRVSPRRGRKGGFILAAVILLLALTTLVFVQGFFSAATEVAGGRPFIIESGTPLPRIVQSLEDEGFIRNYWSVALLLRMQGKEGSVKAGEFILSESMTPKEIVAILTDAAPPEADLEVTIPEGFTVYQIVDRLTESGLFATSPDALDTFVDIEDFTFVELGSCSVGSGEVCRVRFRSLEGYLFPDTYRFEADATVQHVAEKMLKNFSAKFDVALRAEAQGRGIPLHDIVTLASLVEEEAVNDNDRGLIAGVIQQRLDIGMLLQVDATVLYAREQAARALPGARFETLDRELSFLDLKIDSPYNTYRYASLPPGPIASPGLSSLLAALRPEASEYLFYLHDALGNTHFARTNEEHVANKIRYLR